MNLGCLHHVLMMALSKYGKSKNKHLLMRKQMSKW